MRSESDSDDSFEDVPIKRFRKLDIKEVEHVNNGGQRRSRYSENWTESSFMEWRQFVKKDTKASIGDLSEQVDLTVFVQDLSDFILQVKKQNDELYNPRSIEGLVRGIGRLIRARHELHSVPTSCATLKFNILTDCRYRKVVVAGDEAVLRSVNAGLGRVMKKANILSPKEERRVLAQAKCSINSPQGVNFVFAYYCVRNFFVRGASELRKLKEEDFVLLQLCTGEILHFSQGPSKNYKFMLARSGIEQHRPPVDVQIRDVIECYKQLMLK